MNKTENNAPEALRLAAWLNEGAWHSMRLGDVENAGRELRRLHAVVTAPRGTDAQILKERELTASAIMGAIGFGYLGNEAPPDDAAWLRPFYDFGKADAAKDADLALPATANFERMFSAACVDLGLINEALGLDPNDGGAVPILAAIARLKSSVEAFFSEADTAAAPKAGDAKEGGG